MAASFFSRSDELPQNVIPGKQKFANCMLLYSKE